MTKEKKPYTIKETPWGSMLGVALRQLGLIGGSFATMSGLVTNKDFRGFFDYIAGDEFYLVVCAILTIGITLWGLIREWKGWKKLITLADAVPDEIAVVKRKIIR